MKAIAWLLSGLLVCGVSAALGISTALAREAAESPAETTITLQTAPLLDDRGDPMNGRLLLIATLATADGQPVSEQEVSFYERIEFMGSVRNADLGTGMTDVTGTAFVVYQPSTLEEHEIWARFKGTADYAATDAPTVNAQVDELSPTFEAEERPLDAVRRWLPWAVAVVVLATWAVVIGAFARAAVGIRAAEAKEQPA